MDLYHCGGGLEEKGSGSVFGDIEIAPKIIWLLKSSIDVPIAEWKGDLGSSGPMESMLGIELVLGTNGLDARLNGHFRHQQV